MMIEIRKVSRRAEDYPSGEEFDKAYEASVVRSYDDFLEDGHSWVWCLVGNIVKEHEYGEEHEIRRGTKAFPPGAKVCITYGHSGVVPHMLRVIGVPRHSRSHIEKLVREDRIGNLRMQKVYSPALLKRMCSSEYCWWGDLDDDRDEIIRYIVRRDPEAGARMKEKYGTL